jgi:hypothetical protein
VSDRQDEIRELVKKQLLKALAEMNAAHAEVMRLWAEREKIYGPVNKKKRQAYHLEGLYRGRPCEGGRGNTHPEDAGGR